MSATEGRIDPPPGRPDHEGAWSGERDTIQPEEQTPEPQTPPEPDAAAINEEAADPDTERPTSA